MTAPNVKDGRQRPISLFFAVTVVVLFGFSSTAIAAAPKGAASTQAVSVQTVAPIGPDAIGVLGDAQGGLSTALWEKSDRQSARAALEVMGVAARSPARQTLARRLLLTAAPFPVAPNTEGPGESFLSLRIKALLTMGATNDLRRLLDLLPSSARTERSDWAKVESFFIDGNTAAACTAVADGLTRHAQPDWQKASAFCQFLAGKPEAAQLVLAMLREQGVEDPIYFQAFARLSGFRKTPLPVFPEPTPLLVAMIQALKRGFPGGFPPHAPPWLARALTLGSADETETRLAAIRQGLLQGSLSREEAADVYENWTIPPTHFKSSLSALVKEAPPDAEVVLWQSLKRRQTDAPAVQAEVVAQALILAEKRGEIPAMAALYADIAAALPRTEDMVWFAEPAARILLAAGKADMAQTWLTLAKESRSAQGSYTLEALFPLSYLADSTPASLSDESLAQWRQIAEERAKIAKSSVPARKVVDSQQTLLLGLFLALGRELPPAAGKAFQTMPIWETRSFPPLPLWHGLVEATIKESIGETAALVLAALGEAPSSAVAAPVLTQAINSLRRAGLEAEGRWIALEAAIVSGL